MASKYKIEYPKNLVLQGQLSFPIKSDAEIEALKEWRDKKGIKKPKFPDKIGGSLILNQNNWDKLLDYMENTYLPFVDTLYKETNGDKGIEPTLVAGLLKQVKDRNWLAADGKPNLPIRELNDKDKENLGDFPGVGKIKFAGPFEEDLGVKAITVAPDGTKQVVTIASLIEDGIIPESRHNVDTLWWGAGWNFRINVRMNAFDSASVGVTGYVQTLYLLPHLGLPVSGGGDAAVLEDGDDADWE
ncbi:hypothetical protein SEA_PHEDRO_16 [Microbacterium phage Phedro]|uniref:Uncharacterized protein n=4 Tax=Akonivirus phedro TaxID=2845594 RepID=A0A6M3T669_9CAUD|nr:hypothetical protein HWD33_gp16 [Microbacterium phage Phedro]QJD52868.1 hypothetical protein SEA_PHRACTURED_16 [Microbacterium phage Phractured]QJD52923.1 hypothetical protein SEA_PHEDRO_16 [Microbacterium phage Phedro]QJD52978.1 hypothetical protein SEA_PHARKY_16 [Microbacterium phage Pharky]QWY82708.1 hypothetical protein SEA_STAGEPHRIGHT_16 [Microbacterium phage StagePhright]